MTNEELLQQAKDQVIDPRHEGWDNFIKRTPFSGVTREDQLEHQIQLLHEAAILDIQSAREEAASYLSKEDFFRLIGADWTHANANIIWNTLEQHGYKIQKLTAPGR